MWKASPGLCDHVAKNGSYLSALNGLVLRIYGGTEPASSAGSTQSNTMLCEIKPDGGGLNFEAGGSSGVISKDAAQVWSSLEAAAGTATFFRLEAVDDAGDEDSTAIRIQGSVGAVSGDMILSNTTFEVGSPRTIKHFNVVIPSI